MKLLGLDKDAPSSLVAAASLTFVAALAHTTMLLLGIGTQPLVVVHRAMALYFAFTMPRSITRIEPWGYWLNAVLMAPIAIALVGVMVLAEAKGWLSGGGVMVAYRTLGWISVLGYATASILCLLPASKHAADSARHLNGLPIT